MARQISRTTVRLGDDVPCAEHERDVTDDFGGE